MDRRKVVRDTVIIVAIIAIILVVLNFNSGSRGPVEDAGTPTDPHAGHEHNGTGDMSDVAPMHGMVGIAFSDGEPVVSLGEHSIGNVWFEQTVAVAAERIGSVEGADVETIDREAKLAALLRGLEQIIRDNAADEWGIEPDPDELAEREQHFRDSIGNEEEVNAFLAQQGMTMDSLQTLWSKESVDAQLEDKILGETGDTMPDSGVVQTVASWYEEQMVSSPFIFHDPGLEDLYNTFIRQQLADPEESVDEGVQGSD